ncbi:uncharacterized protein B0H18DRAFT_202469 [Fomitopsis serialis]|uniref:uncharacterized protein n=1 Tax=Fomitopsis serialis TaxID=139415 RepID=UPI0020077B74|nr:uncharacterized protein B0H18DRAFT_202469 [Neoantrodia serialis]KAH9937584.1 hypothetical protein B0H18DRAFT_202469 [Neoantrodia serialis]
MSTKATSGQDTEQASSLTNEVVLAMANELKRLRQQLNERDKDKPEGDRVAETRDLQKENERIQRELTVKSSHGLSEQTHASTYDSLRHQLDEVLQARDEELNLHAEVVRGMKAEIATLRNHYEEFKASLKVGHGLTGNERHDPGVLPAVSNAETVNETKFSPYNFLELQDGRGGHGSERPPLCIYDSPPGLNLWAAVRKELSDPSVLDGILHVNPDSIIWHHDGDKRCLLLYASQRFSLCDKGAWKSEGCILTLGRGDTRELVCKSEKAWSYCGQYNCVDVSDISEEDLRSLHPRHTLMNAIAQRTTSSSTKGGQPTHVGKLVREMYRSGALTVRCYGMELLKRDEALDNALEKCAIRRADKKRTSDDGEEGSRKKQKSL